MGVFESKKAYIISNDFMVVDGAGFLNEGDIYKVALYSDHLEFITKRDCLSLKYKSITEVSYKRDCRIKEKQKSVLGRAALGGIMFGSAGSVVGALSGMGTKKTAVYYYAFGIAFKTNDGEIAVMLLEDRGLSGRNLYQQLKKLCF